MDSPLTNAAGVEKPEKDLTLADSRENRRI